MKCYYWVASIMTAILTFACSPEETIVSDEEGQVITITAYREDATIQSKTSRNGNGVISWSAHEEISLFYASGDNGGSKFISTNNASATVADFSGTINAITGVVEGDAERYFWGVYPYNVENSVTSEGVITTVIPDIQTAAEGTFADNHFVSIGKSRGLEMGFYNLCGGFKFRLIQEGVTKVTLKGNNNEALAGKVKVVMENGRPAVSEFLDAKTELVMTCPNGEAFETGVDYFFVMRPITFSNGFTFTMKTADSYVGTRRVNVSIEVLRSLFSYSSSAIDSGVEYKYSPEGAVDLGLSVLWATCNLGASTPEGYGDYYAWGETEPYYTEGHSQDNPCNYWKDGKTGYNWASYRWCNGANNTLTKYNAEGDYGTVDNKTVLEFEDDVARVSLGSRWRMPTYSEWEELKESCTWSMATQNGVNGYLVTATNGNSIFLPAAGYRSDSNILRSSYSGGYYWSSSVWIHDYANNMYFGFSDGVHCAADYRYRGLSVRPVTE